MFLKSIFAALSGFSKPKSQAPITLKTNPQPGKSVPLTYRKTPTYIPSLPSHKPSSYKTTGTRKAMRASKKRQGIKAKLPV